jgi:hypothetical protein
MHIIHIECNIESCFTIYCALHVGFLDDIVIGCTVVTLPYIILVVDVLLLYD